jgi:hypothetical protein
VYDNFSLHKPATSYSASPKRGANKESFCKGNGVTSLRGVRGQGVGMGTTVYSIHMHIQPCTNAIFKFGFFCLPSDWQICFLQTMSSSEICSKIYELKYAMWLKHETPIYGKN